MDQDLNQRLTTHGQKDEGKIMTSSRTFFRSFLIFALAEIIVAVTARLILSSFVTEPFSPFLTTTIVIYVLLPGILLVGLPLAWSQTVSDTQPDSPEEKKKLIWIRLLIGTVILFPTVASWVIANSASDPGPTILFGIIWSAFQVVILLIYVVIFQFIKKKRFRFYWLGLLLALISLFVYWDLTTGRTIALQKKQTYQNEHIVGLTTNGLQVILRRTGLVQVVHFAQGQVLYEDQYSITSQELDRVAGLEDSSEWSSLPGEMQTYSEIQNAIRDKSQSLDCQHANWSLFMSMNKPNKSIEGNFCLTTPAIVTEIIQASFPKTNLGTNGPRP